MAALRATSERSADRAEPSPTSRRQLLAARLGLLVVVLSVATVMLGLRPPRAAGADSAPGEFAAARALPHVRTLSVSPRPVGTPAHGQAIYYLVATLNRLDWQSEVLTGSAANARLGSPVISVRLAADAPALAGLPGLSPRPPGIGLSPLATDITCVARTVTL